MYIKSYLETLNRQQLITISKLWEGHKGVNYRTTTNKNLRLLIFEALN